MLLACAGAATARAASPTASAMIFLDTSPPSRDDVAAPQHPGRSNVGGLLVAFCTKKGRAVAFNVRARTDRAVERGFGTAARPALTVRHAYSVAA